MPAHTHTCTHAHARTYTHDMTWHGRYWHRRTNNIWEDLKWIGTEHKCNFNLKPPGLILGHLKSISEPDPDMADEPVESERPGNAKDKCPITFNKELPREHSVCQRSMLSTFYALSTCYLFFASFASLFHFLWYYDCLRVSFIWQKIRTWVALWACVSCKAILSRHYLSRQ